MKTYLSAGRVLALGAIGLVAMASQALAGKWIDTNQGCSVWDSDWKPGDKASWTGPCVQGKVSGSGTLTWNLNGQISTYVGAYKAGKRNGMGKYTDPSGNWYSGPFVNGVPHGTGRCYAKMLGREWKCTFKAGKIQGMPAGMRGGNK
jgi:hypothetical protein